MLALIADDLTGASDSAVQFARRGWDTLLVLETQIKGAGTSRPLSCLAVTTDARALDNATAEKRTATALAQLMTAGADRVYVKIDSTMRGSIPGQVAGALAAWRTKYPSARAVVCPAYPQMGRTVVANRLLVHGEPVEQTAIGRDPVNPVMTSNLADLIPGSIHADADQFARERTAVATLDAESDVDLAAIARSIVAAGPGIVSVGSAGLAEALAAESSDREIRASPRRSLFPKLPADPRILILVTSLNPVSHAQVAALAQAYPKVEVLLAPSNRVANSSVAETLADAFAERVRRERWDMLGMVGGDGARAALRRLGASAIRILDAVIEGIPLGTIVGGSADGMTIFTKAGGFGGDTALIEVVERIKS